MSFAACCGFKQVDTPENDYFNGVMGPKVHPEGQSCWGAAANTLVSVLLLQQQRGAVAPQKFWAVTQREKRPCQSVRECSYCPEAAC